MHPDSPNRAPATPKSESALAHDALAPGGEAAGVDYDAELRLQNELLRQSYGIEFNDQVLDIGCGTGQTTRDAARMARDGRVLGVDISERMLERARSLTAAAGLNNVTFELADAGTYPFPGAYFDVVISRFGTMFFQSPLAAFSNIARAMRPNGHLVMMVWQSQDRNEWSVEIQRALSADAKVPVGAPAGPDPFSLGDPPTTQRILEQAGFSEARFTEVHQPVYYGRDVDAGVQWVGRFSSVTDVLQRLDRAANNRVQGRLRQMIVDHLRADGVWFDSRAWIVTARR
jgi:ubiquinone/menaquinone biosynthesis C-methylase UbiE